MTIAHRQTAPACVPFQKGFTLIELMVVVAVIGILAAIAVPSYQETIAKSRRADAQRALSEAEQYMRRYFSARDTFQGISMPSGLATSPRGGSGPAAYNIELIEGTAVVPTTTVLSASAYTLQATRTGSMANDRCGDLRVTNTGVRSITGLTGMSPAQLKDLLADCFKSS